MKCMMQQMKQSCKSGRTASILGHPQEQLQYLGMDVAQMVATHMAVIAKKMVRMIVMETTLGPMAHAVER